MTIDTPLRRKPRTLALELVESLGDRIRDGRLALGDKLPTEAAIMAEFSVSRTVVREAISKLQASGLVETRHGIGTFVLGLGQAPGFKITPDQFSTLRDVIAVLELRIGVETEAGGQSPPPPNHPNPKAKPAAQGARAPARDWER
ncbi:GntR family transcriptional regulator, partial [Acidovorax sp.]|uniref:FadR/GntR family transcriptional regulator n=1 Tax=Acidovorax sp. TaxID=1872122 RepID=UPI0025C3CC4A